MYLAPAFGGGATSLHPWIVNPDDDCQEMDKPVLNLDPINICCSGSR